MKTLKLYNTLTHQIEDLKTHELGKVGIYTCGPTVYSYQHIGNLYCYTRHDFLIKTLEYLGYEVKRVMNITDVGHLTSDSDSGEDKMLKGAKRENKTVLEIADFYTTKFFEDFERLNIKQPDVVCKATDIIPEIIEFITKLINDSYAYVSGGNVYFDTSKAKDYYRLNNNKEDELITGFREGVEFDNNKKNQSDFALWFTKSKFDDQELKWESPWGLGYPGWHIECSAISIKYIGEYLDIHCGGVDHIFPHHTNEIAQSEAYLGHNWCSHWVHVAFLNINGAKISKSKGDSLTIASLERDGYNPLAFRFMLLNSSYRKVSTFTFDLLKEYEATFNKLKNKILSLGTEGSLEQDKYDEYDNKFTDAISDDINMPNALTTLYELLKDTSVNDYTKRELISSWDKVFSLDLLKEEKVEVDNAEFIEEKIRERKEAKSNKDFEKADSIRKELEEMGILLKDTREGTTWELIK